VWPIWLADFLQASFPGPFTMTREVTGRLTAGSQWEAPVLRQKAKQVCPTCNHGWMSRLEKATAPVMKPLILGQQQLLSPAEQVRLARWAVKTAATLEFAYHGETDIFVSQAERDWLREKQTPPKTTHVWLAAHDGDLLGFHRSLGFTERVSSRLAGPHPTGRELKSYSATIAVAHFVMKVFGNAPSDQVTVELPGVPGDLVLKVWPASRRALIWPPPLALDTNGLFAFADISVSATE
jgi:hypothetical protein